MVVLILLAFEVLTPKHARTSSSVSAKPRPVSVRLGAWRYPAMLVPIGIALVCVAGPIATLGVWLARGFDREPFGASLGEQITVSASRGLLTAVVCAAFALPVALLVVRYRRFSVLVAERLTYIGFALPGIVVALGLAFFALWVMDVPGLGWVYQSFPMLIAAYSIYDWHLGSGAGNVIQVGVVDPQAGAQLAANRWSTVWYDTAEHEALGGQAIRRSMGSTSHATVFGINLAMTIPFFFYVLRTCKGRLLHSLVWGGLAMTAYCTLLNNTRAALLLVVGIVGLCVLLGLLRVTFWLVMAGIGILIAAPLFIPVDIFRRVLDFQNYTSGNSEAMRIRIDYWGSGFRAFRENWIGGNGLANQKIAVQYLRNPIPGKSHMHNIYLQTLVDVGIFGWILFAVFLGSVMYACLHARKNFRKLEMPREFWMATAACVLVVSVLIYGLQVDVLYFPIKSFWLIIGLSIVMARYSDVLMCRKHGLPDLREEIPR